jgi:hypothetical protein
MRSSLQASLHNCRMANQLRALLPKSSCSRSTICNAPRNLNSGIFAIMRYCFTLHQRHPWNGYLEALRDLGFKSSKLSTHDIEIIVPQSSQPTQQDRMQRILLLKANDWNTIQNRDDTLSRVERLSNVSGGRDVAVVFYLGKNGDEASNSIKDVAQSGGGEGLRCFMDMTST